MKRCCISLFAALVIIAGLSGCTWGLQSETIIIPNSEEDRVDGTNGQSFAVKKIYRLSFPDSMEQVLGWDNRGAVVTLLEESGLSSQPQEQLRRYEFPYADVQPIRSVGDNRSYFVLSPDGTSIIGTGGAKQDHNVLKVVSLIDGSERSASPSDASPWKLRPKALKWSANSQYFSYIVPGDGNGGSRIGVYNTVSGTASSYPLTDVKVGHDTDSVTLSNDGSAALIFTQGVIIMAEASGDEFAKRYEHAAGSDETVWLNNDQFVFLGAEDTLYEYDRRNGELSILLEKVNSFRFSQDRKYIAYTLNDQAVIYAGKLRGNNILNKQAVYQGFMPSGMYWSPDNRSLLIDGRKLIASERSVPMITTPSAAPPVDGAQTFIIAFQ